MDRFAAALSLYKASKSLLDVTRSLAVEHDLLRWAREELEEDLLDLKLAVMEVNEFELFDLLRDVRLSFARVFQLVATIDPEDFDFEDDQ